MVSARLQWFWPLFALVLGYIIYQLRDAMVPFAAAFFLAYALDPLVVRLQRMGTSRLIGTAVVTGLLFFIVITLFLRIGRPLKVVGDA